MAHVYLSAAHKSSGKTTVAIGLCRELSRLGLRVQPFKKGPDYIDPMWLSRACRRCCLNLDFHTMEREDIDHGFRATLASADLGLIEGNVGLFDAVDLQGSYSNAALAKQLMAPVVLVVDVRGMGRGIVPLLLGYRSFDSELNIAGVIANKVGGTRHEANLRRFIEHYTDLPLLGAIHRTDEIQISERHLGLIPSTEAPQADTLIERIRALIADQVEVSRILDIARSVPTPATDSFLKAPCESPRDRVRIAIAQDEAFGFYYPDDLAALARAGADLVAFSPVRDPDLPRSDGLIIGGGFPEFRLRELSANRSMRAAIRDFVETGGAVYAECGGLMYLCRELRWGAHRGAMCGVLNAHVAMHERPQGRGYVRLRETAAFPWPGNPDSSHQIRGHEFHHSAILDPDPDWTYGYEVLRGRGVEGNHDGIVHNNLLAAYCHLRDVGTNGWTGRFVDQVRACRR